MPMDDDFRSCARECLDRAQNADTLPQRNHWIGMAQLWLNLAQHIEQSDPTGRAPASPGDAGAADRPGRDDCEPV